MDKQWLLNMALFDFCHESCHLIYERPQNYTTVLKSDDNDCKSTIWACYLTLDPRLSLQYKLLIYTAKLN